jgi:hypothetical protein
MTANENILHQFYTAFANADAIRMSEFYAPVVRFHDPAFGPLNGGDVPKMWKMLLANGKGKLKIEFFDLKADEYKGSARWIATYTFSRTNRKVVNKIYSQFHFKEGLIIKQTDSFDIWAWAKQAFGLRGLLFGWTGYMQRKIQEKAILSLNRFQEQ